MEFNYALDKINFTVICNKSAITNAIESERNKFEENYFVKNGVYTEDGPYLSKTEYNSNLDVMLELLSSCTSENRMISFIERAQKKKNGTFYKNRIVFREGCDNSIYICEWHTWIYNAISVDPIDDTTLEITYTPG